MLQVTEEVEKITIKIKFKKPKLMYGFMQMKRVCNNPVHMT